MSGTETFSFKSEASELLHLVVHSLYSHKEIFLRELISNASDAIDKRRFEAVKDAALGAPAYEIRLERDAAARTLTVVDNGIGMTRAEAIQNLGTIARSGTREFLSAMKASPSTGQGAGGVESLIGQFGVGFYSSFMVADRVQVLTRRIGEAGATLWESAGAGEFSVADAERAEPGTSVTLFLKPADPEDGLDDFLDEWVLRRIVRKYSDFVTHPVKLWVEKEHEGGNGKDAAEPAPAEHEWATLNSMKAIWTRPQAEVTREEYADFYRHLNHGWGEPFETIVMKGEGTFEYQALAFVPEHAPFDLFHYDAPWGLQLYANRVMILERSKELVPRWLRFLTGVVESPDLPLNVSRELLQNDRRVKQIRAHIVKKVLGVLAEMKEKEPERYLTLWGHFGKVLKEGIAEDHDAREKLAPLLLFASTADPEKLTSLPEVVGRLKEGQEAVYYLTGDSRAALEKAPHLEAFKKKGYEVLLLTDPVDELLVSALPEFQGKKLQSVGKGEVALGTAEERKQEEAAREEKAAAHKDLMSALRVALQDDVKEVRLSTRLTDSAAVLVSDEHDVTPHLARLLKQAGHEVPQGKRILELNPDHALVERLHALHATNADDPRLTEFAKVLFEQALLAEGSALPDPVGFARRVVDLMVRAV